MSVDWRLGGSMDIETARSLVDRVPHWHHRFEIFPGLITPGSYDPMELWNKLALAGRCDGKTVLDVGASDGFFSKNVDAQGGDVFALDYRSKDSHGFAVMERLHGKAFKYKHSNIFDVDAKSIGTFDIVLFLGVLYHLPDMILALRKIRSFCKSSLFLETHSDNSVADIPMARYYRSRALFDDITNFWSPNHLCVFDMLYDTGFDVVRHDAYGDRLLVEAVPTKDAGRTYKMQLAYGRIESKAGWFSRLRRFRH
jgi:tRNA (mo5U34)-methyltransferase